MSKSRVVQNKWLHSIQSKGLTQSASATLTACWNFAKSLLCKRSLGVKRCSPTLCWLQSGSCQGKGKKWVFLKKYFKLLLYYTSQTGFGRYKVETVMIYCCTSSGSSLCQRFGEGSLASSSFLRIHCSGKMKQHLLNFSELAMTKCNEWKSRSYLPV